MSYALGVLKMRIVKKINEKSRQTVLLTLPFKMDQNMAVMILAYTHQVFIKRHHYTCTHARPDMQVVTYWAHIFLFSKHFRSRFTAVVLKS